MSYYSIPYYGDFSEVFYGADPDDQPAGGPVDLTAYQNIDGKVVLYWSMDPITGPAFNSMTWTVQTDLDPTFTSGALATYTSVANPNYIAGCVHKGIVVPAYARVQGAERTMFWRVKGTLAGNDTPWSVEEFVIARAVDQVVKLAMMDSLPSIIYKKDLTTGDTNLAKLYHAIGLEFDELYMAGILVGNDAYTAVVRDSSLAKNFGSLLQVNQPSTMETIDFREILRVLMVESGKSPSMGSIRRVVREMFGVDPDFTFIRDTLDMYVADSTSSPQVVPFWVPDIGVDPATVWDNANLAFGTIIHINNPLGCWPSRQFVETVLRKLTPAFAPVYITGI